MTLIEHMNTVEALLTTTPAALNFKHLKKEILNHDSSLFKH